VAGPKNHHVGQRSKGPGGVRLFCGVLDEGIPGPLRGNGHWQGSPAALPTNGTSGG
jgi:hypothetical protein